MTYDSAPDTKLHIKTVQAFMDQILLRLSERRNTHDKSKLEHPEKKGFDEFTPKLRALTYGSDEYKIILEEMKTVLEHHYAANSHHPEHYLNGLDGMNLLDIIEMLADWKAATMRHADGDIIKSLEINRDRFHLSGQTYQILYNTIVHMGWDKG